LSSACASVGCGAVSTVLASLVADSCLAVIAGPASDVGVALADIRCDTAAAVFAWGDANGLGAVNASPSNSAGACLGSSASTVVSTSLWAKWSITQIAYVSSVASAVVDANTFTVYTSLAAGRVFALSSSPSRIASASVRGSAATSVEAWQRAYWNLAKQASPTAGACAVAWCHTLASVLSAWRPTYRGSAILSSPSLSAAAGSVHTGSTVCARGRATLTMYGANQKCGEH